jgi:hypothetical protein
VTHDASLAHGTNLRSLEPGSARSATGPACTQRGASPGAPRRGELDADETASAAGLDGPYGVAGSLSSLGKAAIGLNVELPFEHTPGADGRLATYRMLTTAKPHFLAARKTVQAR